MEEYDVDISFHFDIYEDGKVELTSDIDDQLDYLNPMERTCIIINLIHDLFTQVYNDVELYDEDSDEFQELYSQSIDMRDNLISAILDFWYNLLAQKVDNTECGSLEYSMAIYKIYTHKYTKQDVNFVVKTAHSDNVNILEPINAGFAFIQDVAECMLNDDKPKVAVKLMINKIILEQVKALNKYIDEYEKDD